MRFNEVKVGMVLHNLGWQLHYLFVRIANNKFISGERIFYNNARVQFDKNIKIYKSGWKDWQLSRTMVKVRPNFHTVIYAIFKENNE